MSKVKSQTAIATEAKLAVPASEKNVETAVAAEIIKTSADNAVEKKEVAPAKKDVAPAKKESAPAKKEAAPKKAAAPKKVTEKKAAEKKVTEKKTTEKKTAAPAKKETAPKKTAAPKKTPAKKPAVKKEPVSSIFIEFEGKQIVAEDVLNAAKKSYESMNKNTEIKTIEIYVKPEENAAYYVVNGEGSDQFKVIL